jgi:hypothetical protein
MTFPNDSSRITRGIGNLETSTNDYSNTPGVAARSLIRKTVKVDTILRAATVTQVANVGPFVYFKNPVRILGVTVMANVASSANILSYATFSLMQITAAGAVGNIIANACTQTVASGGIGNISCAVPFSLTISALSHANNNDRLPANSWVAPDVGATSSGVATGAATWAIDYEEEGPDLYKV